MFSKPLLLLLIFPMAVLSQQGMRNRGFNNGGQQNNVELTTAPPPPFMCYTGEAKGKLDNCTTGEDVCIREDIGGSHESMCSQMGGTYKEACANLTATTSVNCIKTPNTDKKTCCCNTTQCNSDLIMNNAPFAFPVVAFPLAVFVHLFDPFLVDN